MRWKQRWWGNRQRESLCSPLRGAINFWQEAIDVLFHLFARLRGEVGFLNVFRYVSTRMALATLTSLVISFGLAPWFIRRARARQLGEVIREDGPASHATKRGTPTMGGALILLALVS